MKFSIIPVINGNPTRLQVELIHKTEAFEQFKITARNKVIILQTNRLLFQARGLKHRKGDWKVIEGILNNTYALEKITEAIEKHLEK